MSWAQQGWTTATTKPPGHWVPFVLLKQQINSRAAWRSLVTGCCLRWPALSEQAVITRLRGYAISEGGTLATWETRHGLNLERLQTVVSAPAQGSWGVAPGWDS